MNFMRLDKILSDMGIGSRSDIKKYIKSKRICIDGEYILKSDIKIDPYKSEMFFDGKKLEYQKNIYLMLNKPKNVISATQDNNDKTVIDLLDEKYKKMNLFPVGRLDKDTLGLLLITNDGKFAHNTLSPKKHVQKKYTVIVNNYVNDSDIIKFENGIVLSDGYKCKSAKINIIEQDSNMSKLNIEISEGKYHQIKRMFESIGKNVVYLKRIEFAGICLDENLKEGQYRQLNENEMKIINKYL